MGWERACPRAISSIARHLISSACYRIHLPTSVPARHLGTPTPQLRSSARAPNQTFSPTRSPDDSCKCAVSHRMALITSDCVCKCAFAHRMALITSDCAAALACRDGARARSFREVTNAHSRVHSRSPRGGAPLQVRVSERFSSTARETADAFRLPFLLFENQRRWGGATKETTCRQ